MKHTLAAVVGLLLGAAAAAGLVYVNPLTGDRPAAESRAAWRLAYSYPGPDTLSLTGGRSLALAARPQGAAELWEETVRRTAVTSMRLETGAGEHVWATRITVPSAQTNLLTRGLIVADHWLISMPSAGSLFWTAGSNLWPAFKDTYLRVGLLKRPWPGPATYAPTVGPGRIVGATGRFAGHSGRALERIEVGAYDAVRGVEALRGEIAVEFDGPGPFAEAPGAAAGDGAPAAE